MGTIRGAVNTLGSDFDANNRTVGLNSNKSSTLRSNVEANMQEAMRTDYDKPFINKYERENQAKDYLRQTNQIQVDFL